MRKIIYFLPVIAIVAFSSSCKKDDPVPDKFSQKSVEENKEIVETSAIEMAETMGDMKDLETTDVAVSLGNILDQADPFSDGTKKSKFSSTIHVIAGIKTGENSLHDLFAAMKSSGELNEDPETLQELWDDIVGTYVWNPTLVDWDFTAGGDKAIFLFPSEDGGTTNDATLTISDYMGVVPASNPFEDDYTGDLPTALKADLTVGSTTLITYTFTAAYNSDGIPTAVASDLDIETFSFSIDFTNTDTEVSAMYKMMHADVTVMEISGAAKGLLTQENIDNNTEHHSETYYWTDYQYNPVTMQYEEVQMSEVDEWDEVHFEEVINSANAYFQLYNIALRGDVNIKALVDELDKIYEDDDQMSFDEKTAADREAAAINQYLNLRALNVSADEIIAKVEAYVIHDVDEYYDDYYIDFRLKFGDGSLIDLETYFEEGFEDFVAEINTLIGDLNSDYDWDIEEVEY